MITEDYVSFETAKLLKDKGFDECCRAFTVPNVNCALENDGRIFNHVLLDNEYAAPTLQMARKWLKKGYKIDIAIYPYGNYPSENYQFDVYKNRDLIISKDDGYMTYEEAVEAAIKYCLINLI